MNSMEEGKVAGLQSGGEESSSSDAETKAPGTVRILAGVLKMATSDHLGRWVDNGIDPDDSKDRLNVYRSAHEFVKNADVEACDQFLKLYKAKHVGIKRIRFKLNSMMIQGPEPAIKAGVGTEVVKRNVVPLEDPVFDIPGHKVLLQLKTNRGRIIKGVYFVFGPNVFHRLEEAQYWCASYCLARMEYDLGCDRAIFRATTELRNYILKKNGWLGGDYETAVGNKMNLRTDKFDPTISKFFGGGDGETYPDHESLDSGDVSLDDYMPNSDGDEDILDALVDS